MFEHIRRRIGNHLRRIRSVLRCRLLGGGDVHLAVPRDGTFSPDAAIRRLFELSDLPADAVYPDRYPGSGDRDGFADTRPQSLVRHRHIGTVGRAGSHADFHRDRHLQRKSRRVPRRRLRTRRTALVQDSGPVDPRSAAGRLRVVHRPLGVRRMGGVVDHRFEFVSHRPTRRGPHPLRPTAAPGPRRGDGHLVGRHRGRRLVRALGMAADALLADVDGADASADLQRLRSARSGADDPGVGDLGILDRRLHAEPVESPRTARGTAQRMVRSARSREARRALPRSFDAVNS